MLMLTFNHLQVKVKTGRSPASINVILTCVRLFCYLILTQNSTVSFFKLYLHEVLLLYSCVILYSK